MTSTLVTVDRGGHKHGVRADEVPDEGKWYRSNFVDNREFGHMGVLGLDVLQ